MTSAVLFAANNAATRADSNTFPFGTVPFFKASIVSIELTLTIAVAIALRSVDDLWVMLIMVHRAFFCIFFPGCGLIFKNFFSPHRSSLFYPLNQSPAGGETGFPARLLKPIWPGTISHFLPFLSCEEYEHNSPYILKITSLTIC
jgi:hypothetical protein